MTENHDETAPADKTCQPEGPELARAPSGPPTYTNWVAFSEGMLWLAAEEYPLFTDARITGEIDQGPYHFLNTVPRWEPGLVQPAVILRCDRHTQFPQPDMTKTDVDRYHGGSFPEEMAALSSWPWASGSGPGQSRADSNLTAILRGGRASGVRVRSQVSFPARILVVGSCSTPAAATIHLCS